MILQRYSKYSGAATRARSTARPLGRGLRGSATGRVSDGLARLDGLGDGAGLITARPLGHDRPVCDGAGM